MLVDIRLEVLLQIRLKEYEKYWSFIKAAKKGILLVETSVRGYRAITGSPLPFFNNYHKDNNLDGWVKLLVSS